MKFKFHIRPSEILLAVLIFVSSVMLGFSAGGFVINFSKVGFSVMSSAQKAISGVTSTVSGAFNYVADFHNLHKKYNELEEKLRDYEYLQRKNADLRRENDYLNSQLEFSESLENENIGARIIARDPNGLYTGITINKGLRNGIKKGMPVVAVQNGNVGIVGRIVTVGLGTSTIMPVFDSKCNISARIQTSRDIGLAVGNGSLESPMSLNYIRKRSIDEIHYGDVVVSSGENDNYMKGVPIGTITKIQTLDYDSSLLIEMTPVIDFSKLEDVFVVNVSEQNSSN